MSDCTGDPLHKGCMHPPADEMLLARLDSFAIRTRATPVATGQGAAALVRTMLPAVKKDAVADYLATHPSLVDLSAPNSAAELVKALEVQHEQFLREPESFDTSLQIARAVLTAWRNLRREEGKS